MALPAQRVAQVFRELQALPAQRVAQEFKGQPVQLDFQDRQGQPGGPGMLALLA